LWNIYSRTVTPVSNKTVIVPFHAGRDLKKGTFLTILKQAGIEKENLV